MTAAITTAPLDPTRFGDLVEVLGPSEGCDGCWCLNHHIAPGAPDEVGEAARESKRRLVEGGHAGGVIAYLGGAPRGWCAVDPRGAIPGHDCVDGTDPEVWAIHCLYVREEGRGRGLARAMVAAAIAQARAAGAPAVEGYSRPEDPGAPSFDFLPVARLFRGQGFAPAPSRDPAYARWVLDLGRGPGSGEGRDDLPLFVYGTLREGERNARELEVLEGGRFRPARVRGHLRTLGHGGPYTYPAITLDPAGPVVEGQLFVAAGLAARLPDLDAFEGPEYRRVRVTAEEPGGEATEAWIYEWKPRG